MTCVCGEEPKVFAYRGIYMVRCENCGRFSTGDTVKEAKMEWQWMQKGEKNEQDKRVQTMPDMRTE